MNWRKVLGACVIFVGIVAFAAVLFDDATG